MDERNKSIDEWIRQREMANARMRKYRERKQLLESMPQDERATHEIKKKSKEQIEEEKTRKRKESARERSKRYREKKRINALKSIDHLFYDSQIPGPSHTNPQFVTRNESTTFHDFQVAELAYINEQFEQVDILIKDKPIDQHNESTFGLVAQKIESLTNIQNGKPNICFQESEITIKEEFRDDIQIKDEPIDQYDESTFGLVAQKSESFINIQTEIDPIKIEAPSENVLEPIASVLLPTIKTEYFIDEN